jgi:delta-aminolevulinic acid dehydratase/porphobilinogen synthase
MQRLGANKLKEFLDPLIEKGLKTVLLFGVPEDDDKVCW